MALGHTRADVRSGSSCLSATIVAVFVGLCLVGVWMASSTLVSPVEFSPFQAASLWRRPTPTPAGAGTEGNTTPDVSPVVDSEKSADEQEEPPAVRQDAVAEPLERTNQQPDEQVVTEPNVEKPDVDQEQESKRDAEVFPDASQAELLNETATDPAQWSTQAAKSDIPDTTTVASTAAASANWKLCDTEAGADYIPCLDNVEFIRKLQHDEHYEHRERHCPEEPPTCLVPLPNGYRSPIRWPKSRDQIWYSNVPHTQLVEFKGHQNWVNISGEHLVFPGGGTQFKYGALHYIDFIQEAKKDVAWGKRTRVILDVGCGVASFGGYLFDRDVLTMSFAPKDEHEAQVQFALERGIPAISAVMGTKRLPFPSGVFDAVHCARCRVPWHIEGGKLLLELNRVLRPGGYFVWSATPVYLKKPEDVEIWEAMSALTRSMCWELVNKVKERINRKGIAIFQKPKDNRCYDARSADANPPLCGEYDNPDAVWNVSLQSCIHKFPTGPAIRGSRWPEEWPLRVEKPPYWLNSSEAGVYGKPAPDDFQADYEHWKRVIRNSYMEGFGIDWNAVRNVMDMKAVYGGFAAALRNMKVWVMNVVPIDSPDTLPIIYERGLFGLYHDWCESFSTYPRSYDLVHANHIFSKVKKRCELLGVIVEVDRIARPGGRLIVRDDMETISEVESIVKSLHWEVRLSYSQDKEGLLFVQKTMWRPNPSSS
ncbi:probable methyltransferase PMT26 [Lolium rigidum]|uniref:probable methyltransferase PMT26 n=1 Tax=Lolium rigidum TaxID=89674 RepID=UPI001F5CE8B4|nr:probable methyltransferase PMT26 [Lolium rigidum]